MSSDAARFRALADSVRVLAGGSASRTSTFEAVVQRVAERLECHCGFILLSEDGQRWEPVAAFDHDPAALAGLRALFTAAPPHGAPDEPAEVVLRSGKSLLLADLESESSISRWGSAARALARALRLRSLAVAPVCVDGRVLGLLTLARHGHRTAPLEPADLEVVEALAVHLGLALERGPLAAHSSPGEATPRARLEPSLAVRAAGEHESEEMFRQLAENVREVFWIRDVAADRLVYVSPGYAGIWGCPAEEATLEAWVDSLHHEDRERVVRARANTERDGLFDESYRILRPDGAQRWVRDRAFPVRTGGVVTRLVGIAEDITELREIEEQLRQAQKIEAVGRLAGGVAHDFNNLLSVIFGYGAVMQQDLDAADPLRTSLEEILTAGRRAADLTKQLLLFSRRQVPTLKSVDLNALLGNAEKMIRRLVGEEFELEFVPGAALDEVRADPNNLEQVLINLIINARDAMPTGGRVTIETANVELPRDAQVAHLGAQAGPHVMLSVSDTGSGMDKATRTRIFEPFFTTKEQGQGTGLGLSIVFGIVQQHGGALAVESEPGRGSCFRIYLPRAETRAESRAVAPPAGAALLGTETLLLVEDEAAVRAIAQTILRRSGYRVLVAHSAREALLVSEQHAGPIDLLLTDVVMPLMSGSELARRMAKSRPGTRVLFMSGYNDDSVVRHGVPQDAVAFLRKPFDPESLAAKVREVLGAPSGGGLSPDEPGRAAS